MFGIIEYGLDERLKSGIVCLEIVYVLLVDSFAAMVRIGIVDTFGAINGGTSSTARGVPIALDANTRISLVSFKKGKRKERSRAFDFRLRHAMHAVLTHRLLAAAASLSVGARDLDLVPMEDSVRLLGLLTSYRAGGETL